MFAKEVFARHRCDICNNIFIHSEVEQIGLINDLFTAAKAYNRNFGWAACT
jgi:hypothetical protein